MSHPPGWLVSMDADGIIAEIASAQHSAVSRKQLLAAGVGGHVIDHRVATGRLLVVHPGVYFPDGHPRSWEQTLMAAVLAAGPGAVASHRSAGRLAGMPGMGLTAEVSVGAHRAPRVVGARLHRVAQLGPPDTGLVAGIPCTRPARTLIDLAGVQTPAGAGSGARRLPQPPTGQCRVPGTAARCTWPARSRRRRGTGGAPGRTDGSSAPDTERVRAPPAGGPAACRPPRSPHAVPSRLARRPKSVLDIAYPDVRLGIEADSYRHHSSRTDWGRDRTRNRMLTALGWRILPVTWEDLVPTADEVLALVARSLKQRPLSVG